MTKLRRPFLPENRIGIGVDAIAIIANLVLFPFLLSRVESLFDESFADGGPAFQTLAGLMFFILFARIFGREYLGFRSLRSLHPRL